MAVPLIKIENARGEVLDLSMDPRYEPILQGGGPAPATINRAKVAGADGTTVNSSTVGERNLLLTIYLKRDVARARLNLYKYIATKRTLRVYYQADGLDVYIDGIVETAEVDPWARDENMQVSIICPDPHWREITETVTDASVIKKLLEFPVAIESDGIELSALDYVNSTIVYNEGHVESGCIFELVAHVRSTQPRIYNLTTGEYIGLNVDMLQGDRLVINTKRGQKSVTHYRDGERSNYINNLMDGSTWMQLAVGANEYSYTVDEGEMRLLIYHTNMYQGV